MIFDRFSNPEPITGQSPARCTGKASAILRHSADQRAVAFCMNRNGSYVYLCAGCLAAMKAERMAAKLGQTNCGEQQIKALAAVMTAPAGYQPPSNGHRANQIWHALKMWASLGVMRRVEHKLGEMLEVLYVMRDACPDPQCLRRDGMHSENCGLTYGDTFAERFVKQVG